MRRRSVWLLTILPVSQHPETRTGTTFPFHFLEDLHQNQEIPVRVFLFWASVMVSGVFLRDTQRSGLQSAVLAPNGCLSTPHKKDR